MSRSPIRLAAALVLGLAGSATAFAGDLRAEVEAGALRLTRGDVVVEIPLGAAVEDQEPFAARAGWARCRFGPRGRPGTLAVDALRIDDRAGRLRFVLVVAHGFGPGLAGDLEARLGAPAAHLGDPGSRPARAIARHLAPRVKLAPTQASFPIDGATIDGAHVVRLGALRIVVTEHAARRRTIDAIERESSWHRVPHRVVPGDLEAVGEPEQLRTRLLDRYRSPAVRAAHRRPAPAVVAAAFDTSDRVEAVLETNAWRSFLNGCRVGEVRFRSPRPSGDARNDHVVAELYEPRVRPDDPFAVVLLPIWKGAGPTLERFIARHFAAHGVTTLIVPLAWQFGRSPEGVRSGAYTLSDDLDRTRDAIFQSVADARAARRWLVKERGFAEERVGISGTSLGGHVAALAFSIDRKFAKGAFILAGADVASLLWNESRETRKIKRRLRARGVTFDQLQELCRPFDPLTYASSSRGDRVMIVAGRTDATVPPKNARALALAFDEAHLQWIDANHYTGILKLPGVIADIAAFLNAR